MKPIRLTATATLVTLTVLLSACGFGETPPPTAPSDTSKPSVSLVDLNTAVTQAGEVTLKANAHDNVAIKEVKFFVDDQWVGTDQLEPYEAKYTWTTSGTHTVRALASDTAGNINQDTKTVTVTLAATDTIKPVVTITAPTEKIIQAGRYTVTIAASDNVGIKTLTGTMAVQTSTGTNTVPLTLALSGGTVPIEVDSNKNGTYQFTVTATDMAGNTTTVSKTVTVEIAAAPPTPPPADTTAPTVSVSGPTGTVTRAGTYHFTVAANDNVAVTALTGVLTRPNGSTQNVTLPVTGGTVDIPITPADNGTFALTVTAKDAAGNTNSASGTITVNIPATPPADTTAPTVSVSGPVSTVVTAGTYAVTASANDNVGVVSLTGVLTKPDGSTQSLSFNPAGGTQNIPVSAADNGTSTLTVTARDAAGNTSTATISITVNISATPPATDTTPPTITITAPTGIIRTPGFYTVSISASDNVGVVSLTGVLTTPDGVANALTLSPAGGSQTLFVTSQYNGTSTFVATAKDAAGNTTTATATVTVQIP